MNSLPDMVATQISGRVTAFAYLTAEKAQLYRKIMRSFIESKERFVFFLRPQDVLDAVRTCGDAEMPLPNEIETALDQLCEWGNLQMHADTTDVGTVEDFFKQRHTFQITQQGEAVERATARFFKALGNEDDDLQGGALADIRHVTREVKRLSQEPEPDAGEVHRNLLMLRVRFQDLRLSAEAFMRRLEQRSYLNAPEARQLADFAEHFLSELVLAAENVSEDIAEIGPAGFERIIRTAAERCVREGMAPTPEPAAAASSQWRSLWDSFRGWFISQPGCPSHAEKLREYTRASIPALLSIITTFNERRIHRIDRSNDFRVLARWFAEAESDADAHRLWRSVFGLCPARHLIINDATLDDHEAHAVPASTSWMEAPPLRISLQLRDSGSNSRTGRLSRIIDRTAEKQKLAEASREEAIRILKAQRRFGTGRMRLSELTELEPAEFDLLLDLLGEAVSARVSSSEAVEVLSADGGLKLKLEPTGDGQEAFILTPQGMFSGPDHWISIEQISTREVLEVVM